MRSPADVTRIGALVAALVVAALAPSAVASASWTVGGSGSGSGAATTMPGGLAPTGSVASDFVTLNWPPVTFPNGDPVQGYLISRYNASSGVAGAVGGTCTGVVTTTTCTDDPVPVGSWVYTVTPVEQSWTGAESPDSNVVVVKLT